MFHSRKVNLKAKTITITHNEMRRRGMLELSIETITINLLIYFLAPSPCTDSSVSSAEVKRSKIINYFHGNGKKEWDYKEVILRVNDYS